MAIEEAVIRLVLVLYVILVRHFLSVSKSLDKGIVSYWLSNRGQEAGSTQAHYRAISTAEQPLPAIEGHAHNYRATSTVGSPHDSG